MKIGIGMIFFDDLNSLEHCLPTLEADTIYAIDGRFKDFLSPHSLSTDGSREFLKSFNNVKLIDAPDLSQVDKRNIYLKECKEDFIFMVDSDHWIEGNWNEFREEIDTKVNEKNGYGYWFLVEDVTRKKIHQQCLGYYKPNEVTYRHRHDWFEAQGERILPKSHNGKYTELHSLKVYNDQSLRTSKRRHEGNLWRRKNRIKEFDKTKHFDNENRLKRQIHKMLLRFRVPRY